MLLNLLKDTREVYIGIYSDNTLLATQLLNSLKRFPEPLCMHGVVNLSSTEGVNQEHVTVFSDIGASSDSSWKFLHYDNYGFIMEYLELRNHLDNNLRSDVGMPARNWK